MSASASKVRPAAGRDACASCRFFSSDATALDRQFPGLRTLGSVYGSVRAHDGLCTRHARYLSAASRCDDYAPLRATSAAGLPANRS
jgi:hypothetical protein